MNTTVLAEPQTLRRFSLSPAYPEMSDAKERFPSLEISRSNEIHKSPEEYAPVNFSQWQPRQRQDFGRHGTNPFKHRTRKSVSEALGNFTARRGSVSANAQELAESLKAPVSWKLIVCESKDCQELQNLTPLDAMYNLVHELCPDEHIHKIDIEHIPQTDHLDPNSICFRLGVVLDICLACHDLSWHAQNSPGAETRIAISFAGCIAYGAPTICISTSRPYPERNRDRENSRVLGSHDQGSFALIHRCRLSRVLPAPICSSNLLVSPASHRWSNAGMLRRYLD